MSKERKQPAEGASEGKTTSEQPWMSPGTKIGLIGGAIVSGILMVVGYTAREQQREEQVYKAIEEDGKKVNAQRHGLMNARKRYAPGGQYANSDALKEVEERAPWVESAIRNYNRKALSFQPRYTGDRPKFSPIPSVYEVSEKMIFGSGPDGKPLEWDVPHVSDESKVEIVPK